MFAYECLNDTNGSKTIAAIEKNNAQEFLVQKTIQKKVRKANLFENKDKNADGLGNNISSKYSSFLED